MRFSRLTCFLENFAMIIQRVNSKFNTRQTFPYKHYNFNKEKAS